MFPDLGAFAIEDI